MTPQDTVAAIRSFSHLGKKQRRTALNAEERAELAVLDGVLRDVLEGTRPAPKQIANPRAANPGRTLSTDDLASMPPMPTGLTDDLSVDAPARPLPRAASRRPRSSVSVTPASQPAPPSTRPSSTAERPAQIQRAAAAKPKAMSLSDLANKVSEADQSKLGEVHSRDLPTGGYTPSKSPAFLGDYYSADLEPVVVTRDVDPSTVVAPDGSTADLDKEARILFGLETAPPPAATGHRPLPEVSRQRAADSGPTPSGETAPVSVERIRRAAPPPPAPAVTQKAKPRGSSHATKGIPVIVHMMTGGTTRGRVKAFNPSADTITITVKTQPEPLQIDLQEVLVIFFGGSLDGTPTPEQGTALAVRLTNDRQISGVSPDYAEGADALRLVPDTKRGNIDHIWVPAWSVKAVELR